MKKHTGWIAFGIVATVLVLALMLWGIPQYRIYNRTMRGKAALQEAQQDRLIRIEEAKANLEAEKLNAQAEVERARGMAEAMQIENGQLTERYNQYLFIRTLEKLAEQGDLPMIIYLPTEANMPILEATRLNAMP